MDGRAGNRKHHRTAQQTGKNEYKTAHALPLCRCLLAPTLRVSHGAPGRPPANIPGL